MEKEDKEIQQLVKRLAKFLGLKAVEKRVLGFKRYVVLRDQRSERYTVSIRGYQANFRSWEDALCKFLGANCFNVGQKVGKIEGKVLSEVLLIDNPFFGMSPEVACLHLDLLAPEKEER